MTDRDELAKAKGIDPSWLTADEVEAYRLGVAAERKRCAEICRNYRSIPYDAVYVAGALECADRIERGE